MQYNATVNMLLKAGLPVPHSVNRGQLAPLIVLENEEATAVDLSGSAQHTPEFAPNLLATFRMSRKDISEHNSQRAEASRFLRDSSISSLTSHSTSSASGVDLAMQPATLSPLPSFTTAAPTSPTLSAFFMDDSLGAPSYHMSGAWDVQTQLNSSVDLQTHLMMDGMTMPALNGCKRLSPSMTGFGESSVYPPPLSSGSMSARGSLPDTPFPSVSPYQDIGGASAQVFGWDF